MTDHSEILGSYKGVPVTTTAIIVNRLGDGLSAAVDIEPIVVEVGEDVYMVARLTKTKDRYDFTKDDAGNAVSAKLIQIFDSTGATFADAKLARVAVQKMVERISEEEARRKGQLTLSLVEEDNVTDIKKAR